MRSRSERWGAEPASLRALPVRLAAIATPPVAAAAFIAAAATDTPLLMLWAAAAGLVFAVAAVQLIMRRPHPPILMMVAITTMVAVARFSPVDPIPGMVTGMFTISLVVIVVFERSKVAIPYVAWVTVASGLSLWWEHPGWGAALGFAVLASALTTSWLVLDAAARELWNADQRHRNMLENASDALIAFDNTNAIVLVNRQARRTFGYEAADATGRQIDLIIPAFRSHDDVEAVCENRDSRRSIRVTGIHRDGHDIPVEVQITPMDSNGDHLYLAIVRDVTREVAAEERADDRLRVYRDLFDGVPIGLYRTAPDGRILDANPALAAILGYELREALIGTNARDHFADPDERATQIKTIDDSLEAVSTEVRLRRRDGNTIWVRDRTRAVRNAAGRVLYYEGAIQNTTEERRALDRLQSEIRSKTELVAAVSHELRTPLTAVLGFIDLLRAQSEGASADHSEYLRLAAEQANDLALLVEDLLTATRIEHNDLVILPEQVGLEEAVVRAVEAVGSRGTSDVRLDLPPGLSGWCDPSRLRQIVRNLIANALIHGRPPVVVTGREHRDGSVTITVGDHGAGIADDAAARIFDAFYRGHEARTRSGSIGLGLAISRRLAILMNGDLEYRRASDMTEFVLTLPGSAAAQGTGENGPEEGQAA